MSGQHDFSVEGQQELSDGLVRMPRLLTPRERTCDLIFLNLQIFSWLAPLLAAVIGARLGHFVGAMLGAGVGFLSGWWVRHSMGGRSGKDAASFYKRVGQRAQGSPPRILERWLESYRGNALTRAKCQAMWDAYQEARTQMGSAVTEAARRRILEKLDAETKRISYE